MSHWVCPDCNRTFGAKGRGHICKPGTTIEELAERSIPTFRPVVDAVAAHLRSLPDAETDLIVDPLDKLVQFKRGSVFCIVRPMTKWTAVGFSLRRALDSPRMSRKVTDQGGTFFHTINVHDATELDREIYDWLAEAYESTGAAKSAAPSAGDPMVPDDVDIW